MSLATHLKARGVSFRIFGEPMRTWLDMPRGMFLKSLGFATNVYTPDGRLGFVAYSAERGLETSEPCAIADFARYGIWVQKWEVPELERTSVTGISRDDNLFRLTLANGKTVHAARVVIAVGVNHFARMPGELAALPRALASHTSHHSDYADFSGKDVCVIGAGQSAFEAARLLQDAGARPQLLVRESTIEFSGKMPAHRSLWERIRRPHSGLGPGLKNWVLETFPLLVHFLPDRWRLPFVKTHLGPQGAWWLRDRIEGKVPVATGCSLVAAAPSEGRLSLLVRDADGIERTIVCDHVITGTGFEVDVDRLTFIDPDLRGRIRRVERAPALDHRFQSSVPGLYFIGFASSPSFGPLFRFVAGAAYTSRALSRECARHGSVKIVPVPARLPGEHSRATR